MEENTYTLILLEGPLARQTYPIAHTDIKLGRSSQCDIHIPDPELSRSHCCFEIRKGELWVVDLASANQTFVNGKAIDECRLFDGDILQVGTTKISVSSSSSSSSPFSPEQTKEADGPVIDLGFRETGGENAPVKKNFLRPVIWTFAALLILVLGATYIFDKKENGRIAGPKPIAAEEAKTLQIRYEKVEADTNNVFRYELTLAPDKTLRVKIDDLSAKSRHVRKEKKLSDAEMKRLTGDISSSGFFALEKTYTGFAKPGSFTSCSLFAALGKKAHLCKVENRQEPEAFRALREKLETFSKNELGIWAIQFSSDKLMELARDAQRAGAKKFDERDVTYGNLFESIRSYQEAVFYLDTVNPKPDFYAAVVDGFERAEGELDKRYKNQRFLADRAINLKEWLTAVKELKILCEMIPDREDRRHKEAAQKLLDVESRVKKEK